MAVVTRDTDRGKLRGLLRARTWAPVLIPLSVLALVLAIAFAAEWLYQDRALPGVTVGGVDVGSLTRATLIDRLDEELATPFGESAVTVTASGHTWRSTNAALGIRPDVAAAADSALGYGKRGSVLERLGAWADALRGDARLPFTLVASGDALDHWLGQISSDVDRPAVSGFLALHESAVSETTPVLGRRLDKITSAASVLAADSLGDRTIDLTVRDVYPEVDPSGFDAALAQLRAAVTPLDVSVEERHQSVDATQLAPLVHVQLVTAKPGDLPAIPGEAIAPAVRYRYVVSLDADRLAEWVTALAASLDRPAVDARYSVSKDGVLSVVPGKSGIKIDQDKLKTLLATALLAPSSSATRPVSAPAVLDATSFTTADAQKWLPQLTKTSSFTTYFPVSASRHANIATGSSQFDGVVIQPGATFSFWSLLGPVTPERGYAYAGA
ncbi:MAG TPA: peptidoglycan binding domain-containing protein, partial [Candidatus Limnocylindria bacterium]